MSFVPETKPEPVMLITKSAGVIDVTVAVAIAGIGLRRVATVFPVTLELLLRLAEIVTVFGVGSDVGVVYKPLASIVPAAALPPVVPLTAQVSVPVVLDT